MAAADVENAISTPVAIKFENETNTSASNNDSSTILLGVVHVDYPKELITITEMRLLQKAIVDKILEPDFEEISPAFRGVVMKCGFMVLRCADEETAAWIENIVPTLKPWKNANLRVFDAINPPTPVLVVGFLPKVKDDNVEHILSKIKEYNESMNFETDNWTVIGRSESSGRTQIIISVDDASIKKLKEVNFSLQYYTSKITLRDDYPLEVKPEIKPVQPLPEELPKLMDINVNKRRRMFKRKGR